MKRYGLIIGGTLLFALIASHSASAQKHGGILKLYSPASPASMSPLEEATLVAEMPMMGVFNNLILFDQHVPQVSLQSIVPDLATSWVWNEDGTELSFTLRQGIKWHDGKPFTAQDVKCTMDLYLDKGPEKLQGQPAQILL
jgi:peptide/nickel transport system substrate-binding protein